MRINTNRRMTLEQGDEYLRQRIVALLAVLVFFLCGCNAFRGEQEKKPKKNEEVAQPDEFLEAAVYDFSYEKPKKNPNILLNRNGYDKEDSKVAFLKGEELPEEFSIVDINTKQVVFSGKIEKATLNEKSGLYFAKAEFSDFEKEGSYYLQAKYIGRSYSFDIAEDRLHTVYDNVVSSFYYHRCGQNLIGEIGVNNHRACHKKETYLKDTEITLDTSGGWHTDNNFNKNVVESTKIMSELMLTYEFLHDIGNVLKQEIEEDELDSMQALLNEVYYEIQFLLKMQDEKTGAFYSGVQSDEELATVNPEDDTRKFYVADISTTATAECVAVLAQFSRIYEPIEPQIALNCLNAAAKGYGYLERQNQFNEEQYYAACELYKTTGQLKYSNYILNYLKNEQAVSTVSENGENSSGFKFGRKIYGDLAYLTTTYKVDMEQCSIIMNQLMNEAQRISACAKADDYLVYATDGKRDSQTILEAAFILAIIDHIVTSHEYIGVMENQVDYLFGRNEIGENLVTNKGVLKGINEEETYDLYLQSTLVFILHELIEREAE